MAAKRRSMYQDYIGPEDIELGELIDVYGPDPRRGVRVRLDLPPEIANPLFDLAERSGGKPLDLARELLREAIARRLAEVGTIGAKSGRSPDRRGRAGPESGRTSPRKRAAG
jgi:hypothetical protein